MLKVATFPVSCQKCTHQLTFVTIQNPMLHSHNGQLVQVSKLVEKFTKSGNAWDPHPSILVVEDRGQQICVPRSQGWNFFSCPQAS